MRTALTELPEWRVIWRRPERVNGFCVREFGDSQYLGRLVPLKRLWTEARKKITATEAAHQFSGFARVFLKSRLIKDPVDVRNEISSHIASA